VIGPLFFILGRRLVGSFTPAHQDKSNRTTRESSEAMKIKD
jgi:hypothetical protein